MLGVEHANIFHEPHQVDSNHVFQLLGIVSESFLELDIVDQLEVAFQDHHNEEGLAYFELLVAFV